MHALLRLAGWSALWAGVVHLVQFLVLGIGPALHEPDYPTPAQAASHYWFGLAGSTTFTLVALGYLVFFSAATELAWHGATGTAVVWRRAAQTAATVGIACWLLSGMTNLARRGFNATGIGEAAGSDDVARAALQAGELLVSAAAPAMAVMFGAWWLAFAVRTVRTATIGRPTAALVVLAGGVLPVAGWAADLGGVPSIVLAFLVLGPVLLRRAAQDRAAGSMPESAAATAQ